MYTYINSWHYLRLLIFVGSFIWTRATILSINTLPVEYCLHQHLWWGDWFVPEGVLPGFAIEVTLNIDINIEFKSDIIIQAPKIMPYDITQVLTLVPSSISSHLRTSLNTLMDARRRDISHWMSHHSSLRLTVYGFWIGHLESSRKPSFQQFRRCFWIIDQVQAPYKEL